MRNQTFQPHGTNMFILYLLLYSTDVCFYNVYDRIELSNRKAKAYNISIMVILEVLNSTTHAVDKYKWEHVLASLDVDEDGSGVNVEGTIVVVVLVV